MGNQRPAIVMTGQYRAAINVQCFVKALIGKMRYIEDHPNLFHGLEQRSTRRKQAAFRSRPVGVGANAIMSRANDAEAGLPPFLNLIRREDGVGTFHAEDETQGRLRRLLRFPGPKVRIEVVRILDPRQNALLFQGTVIGQLTVSRRIGGFHGAVALEGRHSLGLKRPC